MLNNSGGGRMSIQQRIADILTHHDCWDYNVAQWADHIAEVLVAELGLTEEEGADFTGGGLWRYVTAWEQTPW